ncbi:MAG: cbb3-type cytochrome c oxidase subunit I, partial [Alphaproteobacteria bacterium]|nr:cbb3-type cytochrome c oxidase subunit I [Alphaproteobacteria bacterium]
MTHKGAPSGGGAMVMMALWGLLAVLAITMGAKAVDTPFAIHMFIFALAAILALIFKARSFGKPEPDTSGYMDNVVRYGAIATVFWGVVGFLVGLVIALQLAYPAWNPNLEWFNFGRLRPLHTSAVVFAFGGNALLCTSFYVVQRTNRTRLALGNLAWFVFWGYQLFIVLAATGYLLGVTEGREYAEPEWYIDLWLTVVWVAYFLVFFGTLLQRKESHIYVANWFYLAFIVTIAMLHIVNNLSIPVSFFGSKSYSLFSGVQDALTQWWYGHNAVGFFLTAGFLGMMYYFIP